MTLPPRQRACRPHHPLAPSDREGGRMSCAAAAVLEEHCCEIYIPKHNEPDSFEAVQVTARDLHHVMDTHAARHIATSDQPQDVACQCGSADDEPDSNRCGRVLHVVEEAVDILHEWEWVAKSPSGVFVPKPDVIVARFWVCQACECGFTGRAARARPCRSEDTDETDSAHSPARYSDTAPKLSFASGRDFGRAYLPRRVAVRTSWRGNPLQCRLPLAAYDHHHSQSHASNTRRRLQF
jgi:hypothetical protein